MQAQAQEAETQQNEQRQVQQQAQQLFGALPAVDEELWLQGRTLEGVALLEHLRADTLDVLTAQLDERRQAARAELSKTGGRVASSGASPGGTRGAGAGRRGSRRAC